jgi:hypothetical protein
MLKKDEIVDSFEAVREFLFDGERFSNGGDIPCYFIERRQRTETTISIEIIDSIPSYNLHDEVFKSYGLRSPIWSAYRLFKWDAQNKELIIEVNEYQEIRLKRVQGS